MRWAMLMMVDGDLEQELQLLFSYLWECQCLLLEKYVKHLVFTTAAYLHSADLLRKL